MEGLEPWVQMVVTVICSVVASSGFWTWFSKRNDKNDAKQKLLVGLAHDRIMYLGSVYIERGYITKDEYENLNDYLFEPYSECGGNGSAKKIMAEVNKLPMHEHHLGVDKHEHS